MMEKVVGVIMITSLYLSILLYGLIVAETIDREEMKNMGSALKCIGCKKDVIVEENIRLLIVDDTLYVEYTCPECGINATRPIHEYIFKEDKK